MSKTKVILNLTDEDISNLKELVEAGSDEFPYEEDLTNLKNKVILAIEKAKEKK